MVEFMGLIVIFTVMIFAYRSISDRYSIGLNRVQKYPVRDTIVWLFTNIETRKRLLITIAILLLLRVGFYIPLPGVDAYALQQFFESIMHHTGSAAGVLSLGGSLSRISIFALGLMPVISACLLLQFASVIIPPLRRFSFGGEQGRRRIFMYTYILAIILSLVQSRFLSGWLENPSNFQGMVLVSEPGWSFRIISMISLTASVMLLLFIASLIDRYGIGNGIAIIVVSSFVFGWLIRIFSRVYFSLQRHTLAISSLVVWFVILGGVAYLIFHITRMVKSIKIRGDDNKISSISLRPTIIATVPITLAAIISFLPSTARTFLNAHWIWDRGSIFSGLLFSGFIIIFTYLYVWVVFKPLYFVKLMEKYNFSLADNNTSEPEKYLAINMKKVLVLTAFFLVGYNFMPVLIRLFYKNIHYTLTVVFVSGVGIATVVGVFWDIFAQLEFFRDQEATGIKDWDVCYIAFDEIEAEIKKAYLIRKDIQALVKPYRYTWGMPIRTMIDQYQIYVPIDKKDVARSLIIK